MNQAKENLILHPVRLRILLTIAGRQLTAQQLAAELMDIPQASLYRNLKVLADGGMLNVVSERRVHSTLEKTYALPEPGVFLTPEDVKNARPEDLLRLFTQYLGQMLGYYARYVQRGNADLVRDKVTFQLTPYYLNETETTQLGQALNAALQPYLKNEPTPDRQRSILALAFLPDVGFTPAPAASQAGTTPHLGSAELDHHPTDEDLNPQKEQR